MAQEVVGTSLLGVIGVTALWMAVSLHRLAGRNDRR